MHIDNEQCWLGLLGFEHGDFDGHLLYIEWDMGSWKLDFLWLRPLYLKCFIYT